MIVSGEELGGWIWPRLGRPHIIGECQYIGLVVSEKLVAVSAWAGYNGASIYCHIAIDGKMSREFLKFLHVSFKYAFEQLKCKKIIGIVESDNPKALKLDKHLGFIEEYIIKEASPNGDIHILTMTKDLCKYL